MRTASSALGVIAAGLLVGACFDPTRQCSTNADCVNGGTCDPGTKTCVAAGNPNDHTPPVFSITVTPAPARPDTTKLTGYDPGSPSGGHDAFRRDEDVHVVVTSADRDVDAGSFIFSALGISQGLDGRLVAAFTACGASNPAASNPFCQEGTIHLAQLPFDAFRGTVWLEARGADLSNNVGTADAGINVTRWKWRYSAGAPIYTTPAIADDGTVVFGTSDGGSGSVYALSPDGSEKWAPVTIGPIKASPVVGSSDGGQQLAYVANSSSSSKIFAINLMDGSSVASCPAGVASYSGAFMGTPALVMAGDATFEGALALASGTKLVSIRPAAAGADPTCITTDTPATQALPSNVVVAGIDAYVATAEGLARAFTFDSGNWVKNSAWGGGLGYTGVGDRSVQSIVVTTNSVLGTTSLKGAFKLERVSGALQSSFPVGGLSADPGPIVLTSDGGVFGSGQSATPLLYSVHSDLADGQAISLTQAVVSAPAAGKGGFLYVATSVGGLEARLGLTSTAWSNGFGPGESFLASPTLGCSGLPGATSGAVYLAATSGNLFAVIVDSPGLDSSAPWPKYQHDVRNTGNPTTPIQSCP